MRSVLVRHNYRCPAVLQRKSSKILLPCLYSRKLGPRKSSVFPVFLDQRFCSVVCWASARHSDSPANSLLSRRYMHEHKMWCCTPLGMLTCWCLIRTELTWSQLNNPPGEACASARYGVLVCGVHHSQKHFLFVLNSKKLQLFSDWFEIKRFRFSHG